MAQRSAGEERPEAAIAQPENQRKLTKTQRGAFISAFGGWSLDGYNASLFGLVLSPALTDLLPRSGYPATTENIAFFGLLVAVGSARRSLRPSADPDGQHPHIRTVHLPGRLLPRRLAAEPVPAVGGHRDRRGVVAGRHICGRVDAGAEAGSVRRPAALGHLLGVPARRGGEHLRRPGGRLALDVLPRCAAGAVRALHPHPGTRR